MIGVDVCRYQELCRSYFRNFISWRTKYWNMIHHVTFKKWSIPTLNSWSEWPLFSKGFACNLLCSYNLNAAGHFPNPHTLSQNHEIFINITLTTLRERLCPVTFIWHHHSICVFMKEILQRDTENERSGLQPCVFSASCKCTKTASIYAYHQLKLFERYKS